ncbi:MAG TPA: hypothetical protein VLT58_12955, partial [Polyangia bacterium]|nr:hypothetical protein [Polyangia bacterium]
MKRGIRLSSYLFWLAATLAVAASCSFKAGNRGGTQPGVVTAPGIPGLTSLQISPVMATLTVTGGGP